MVKTDYRPFVEYLSREATRKFQNGGSVGLAKSSVAFVRDFVKNDFTLYPYQTERIDLDSRWEMMKPYISSTDRNLLDIGCAEGYVIKRAAELGLFCVGIDSSEARLARGRSRRTDMDNILFFNYHITPENVTGLPAFDVTCMLTVYHYFGMEYGWKAAEDMLRTIGEKTNKIFFEPPGAWSGPHPFDEHDSPSFEERYRTYLESVFHDRVEVEFIGNTAFKRDSGPNPVFVIYSENY